MKVVALGILISAAFSIASIAEEKKVLTGFLVDQKCAAFYVESQPEKLLDHSKGCVMACGVDAGFGLVVKGGFIPFDEQGNKLAREWLEQTSKQKELRATVTFLVDGDNFKVEAIKD